MPYKPKPFIVPMVLHVPEYSSVKGIRQKTYTPHSELNPFFGSFSTYGGTEHEVNGTIVVEDTAIVETWYHPDIKANCAVSLDDSLYEIIENPEDIDKRHQYSRFKIQAIKGGA